MGAKAFKEMTVEEKLGLFGKRTLNNFFNESTRGIDVLQNWFLKRPINLFNDPTDIEERLQAMVVMKWVWIR